jgi:hypothetical protein
MRLLLVPVFGGVAAMLAAPTVAQPALPARVFEPSLAAVAPDPALPVTEWWRTGGPRIRPTDRRANGILSEGVERSARLRALAHRVESSDVFVYVGMDPRMADGLAGVLTFVGHGYQYRYLRVALNSNLLPDRIIASLAHELQHVVEVVEHPEVTSDQRLGELYKRIGVTNQAGGVQGWETKAAKETTYEVRRELRSGVPAALVRQQPSKAPAGPDHRSRDESS